MTVIPFRHFAPAHVEATQVLIPDSLLRSLRAVGWYGDGYISAKQLDDTLMLLKAALTHALGMHAGARSNDPVVGHLGDVFGLLTAKKKGQLRLAYDCVCLLEEHMQSEREGFVTVPQKAQATFDLLFSISWSALCHLWREQCEQERKAAATARA